jgi:hypothetical protein
MKWLLESLQRSPVAQFTWRNDYLGAAYSGKPASRSRPSQAASTSPMNGHSFA